MSEAEELQNWLSTNRLGFLSITKLVDNGIESLDDIKELETKQEVEDVADELELGVVLRKKWMKAVMKLNAKCFELQKWLHKNQIEEIYGSLKGCDIESVDDIKQLETQQDIEDVADEMELTTKQRKKWIKAVMKLNNISKKTTPPPNEKGTTKANPQPSQKKQEKKSTPPNIDKETKKALTSHENQATKSMPLNLIGNSSSLLIDNKTIDANVNIKPSIVKRQSIKQKRKSTGGNKMILSDGGLIDKEKETKTQIENEQSDKVDIFMTITAMTDRAKARKLLEENEWNLEKATANQFASPPDQKAVIRIILPDNRMYTFQMDAHDTFWGVYGRLVQSVPELLNKPGFTMAINGSVLDEPEYDQTLIDKGMVPRGDIHIKFAAKEQYNGQPMTQAFDSQKGQGMGMNVAFERNTMVIKVDNKSNGDISRIDIKFKKNYLGIQPQGSVPLNGNVSAGQSQTVKLTLQLSQDPISKQPLDLMVQMSARTMNSSLMHPIVTLFKVQIPAEIFFDNQNGNTLTDRSAFLAEWRSIPNTENQSQAFKPCTQMDTNAAKDVFMKNGCSFIVDRQIPNRGVSLYFASTLRNVAVLLEVSLANNGACRLLVKSKNKYLSYVACQTGAKLIKMEADKAKVSSNQNKSPPMILPSVNPAQNKPLPLSVLSSQNEDLDKWLVDNQLTEIKNVLDENDFATLDDVVGIVLHSYFGTMIDCIHQQHNITIPARIGGSGAN